MVKLTMIARVSDGLPLAEGLEHFREHNDFDFYKQKAKQLFKIISEGQNGASRMSLRIEPYCFHYIIEDGVCYITLCDQSYPRKLAFHFLEDLQREFGKLHLSQIETASKPYAFIKFGGLLLARVIAATVCTTLAASMATWQGTISMVAFQICLQIWMVTSLLADALALAGQAILGSAFAVGDYEKARSAAARTLQEMILSCIKGG